MTATTSVTGTSGTTRSTAASAVSALGNLNANDFLTLLTTELKNQDPTKPVDNAQMIAQLAQFTQLSNSSATNTNLARISGQIDTIAKKIA